MLRGRPGPFAGPWRLGSAFRYPQERAEPVEVNYNVPVGSGRVAGSVEVLGRRIDLDGWRGSWEHVWGSFEYEDDNWRFWDAYSVQMRGGGAWIAFGLNRSDTVLGPGSRDAQWLGVLARVGPRGRASAGRRCTGGAGASARTSTRTRSRGACAPAAAGGA